ncbi:MAG: long-chain-fatty-acid--CoA ligase [Aggregatilineales bacterium]
MEQAVLTKTTFDRPWLKHYDFWVPAHLTYPHRPVDFLLDTATMQYPDTAATIFYGQKLTYRELTQQVNQMAAALQGLGIHKGDRVGLMLPNCPQFVIAYFAILRTGAIVVNINPLYTPREIGLVIGETQASMIITLDQGAPNLLKARDAGQFPALKHIIAVTMAEYMSEAARAGFRAMQEKQGTVLPPLPDDVIRWSKLLADNADKLPTRPDIDADDDVAVLQFTGGTTGTPKGAMLTHFNIMANTLQGYFWGKQFIRAGQEIYLTIIPMFHVYGMTSALNACTLVGGTLLLMPRFDAAEALQLISTYKPGYFPGVPTMYIALLNHPAIKTTDISSLRLMNSGSAPLPREVQTRFQAYCSGIFAEGYGLSEASPTTHCNPVFEAQRAGSVGIPFPDTDAKIVDPEDGHEVPQGERGELIVSGPQVMKGYYNRPEETANTLRRRDDGKIWLYTGDIARMDADGYFEIVDRKKDLILVGGFNVYPREVEEVLFSHPAVQEATAIGVPDAYSGEAVKVFVVLKAGTSATADEIIAYCRERLAGYKTPSQVVFAEQLPKSSVGKVLRTELRKQ